MEDKTLTSLFIDNFSSDVGTLSIYHENDDGSTLTGYVRIESKNHYQVYVLEKNAIINITANETGKLICYLGKRKNPEWVDIICFLVSEKIKSGEFYS
jgi:hypothetical protein